MLRAHRRSLSRLTRAALLALAATLSLACQGEQAAWQIKLLDSQRKLFPAEFGDIEDSGNVVLELHAARNESESFQLALKANQPLHELNIEIQPFLHANGEASLEPVRTYRQHLLHIEETPNTRYGRSGWVPDALVPLIHPSTGKPTGGKYGGERFNIDKRGYISFWFDQYIPADALPGLYHSELRIHTADGESETRKISLRVSPVTLPRQNALKACFQLSPASVQHSHKMKRGQASSLMTAYQALLQEHGVDNWSPGTGFNYGANGVKVTVIAGRLIIDWREFDRHVTAALDGSAFADGRPAQCLFLPYWMPIRDGHRIVSKRLNKDNVDQIDEALLAQWFAQLEAHLRKKGWLDRAMLFYLDEPFLQDWKYDAFQKVAGIARKSAPGIKIMLTDGYRGSDGYAKGRELDETFQSLIDIWNPVTWQVSTPERLGFYRQRAARGETNMWCQTIGNANKNKPFLNLFPEFDIAFHRMWGVLSWDMGFSALEMWAAVVWWDEQNKRRIDPWTEAQGFPGWQQTVNGEGRLLYPGTADAIGGPDIPIATIRLKAIRDAIEDYQYLQLLEASGRFDQFDITRFHATNKRDSRKMSKPMATGRGNWRFWEGDGSRWMAARREILTLLEQN